MEKNDIKELLASFAIEFTSDTRPNSYRIQEKSSLLADPKAISTRANSIWKMSQYIIAYNDNNSKNKEAHIEDYIVGWSTLVKNFIDQEQFLFLEISEGRWYIYDSHSEKIGETENIEDFIAKRRRIFEESKKIEGEDKQTYSSHDLILQKIVYGAPGTGKSFATDVIIHNTYKKSPASEKEYVFRTTFHPDSDYSTFVGCYKPTKEKSADYKSKLLSKEELVERLKEYRNLYEETQAQTQFGFDYYESLRFRSDTNEILKQAAGKTFDTCIRVGMAIAERSTPKSSGNITYDFVPQSFTKAYIKAWEEILLAEYGKKDEEQKVNLLPTENGEAKKVKAKPVFLVIEEINRGNCAQIFGDLFQLLDREDDGMSCYPIKPDTDLGNYIAGELRKFAQEHNIDIDATGYKEIINGEEMLLPDNLYIWATMNTSDQSLFPIDSAFKRRWDWEYVPISEGYDRKENKSINYTIKIGNETCDWWEFVKAINKKIGDTTKSEDKKLGFYFCKADNKIIDAKKFVGKVIFYLWNDVFKDYETDIFNIKSDDSNPTFEMFYKSDKGKTEIDDVKVKEFIEKVCPGIFSKVNSEEKQREEE